VVAKYLLRPHASCSSPRPAPRRCRNRRRTTRQICSGEEHIYPAQQQVSPRAGAPLASSSRWPWLCGGRSTTGACLRRWRLGQKKLGVGLRRSCRGQACGGMLGAIARIAPAGGTARSTEVQSTMWASNRLAKFRISVGSAVPGKGSSRPVTSQPHTESQNFTFGVGAVSGGSTL
jgi:hypothetical protein